MSAQLGIRPRNLKLRINRLHCFKRLFQTHTAASSAQQPVWGYQKPEVFCLPDFTPEELDNRASQPSLVRLVEAYRRHAHRSASLDPLSLTPRPPVPALDPRRYGFGISTDFIKNTMSENHLASALPSQMIGDLGDENKLWNVKGIVGMGHRISSNAQMSLAEIVQRLEEVYCGRIGYEYMHLPNKFEREWISNELESKVHDLSIDLHTKRRYWKLLHRSEAFDRCLGTRFPNIKRYGLEGGETMLVALDRIFEECGANNIGEVVVAMPHRGRLNLLTQLLSLDLRIVSKKLKGKAEIPEDLLARTPAYTGDVLSHLSNTTQLRFSSLPLENPVNVHVLPNPSHLEAVSAVGLGVTRAFGMHHHVGPYADAHSKQVKRIGDDILSVQIHGDAAFGGQGVVAETLNLSTLPHFTVGGSIRLVLNNQLGYTTPAIEGRTSFYATDVGKSIEAPIIHVNGEYPEDVSRALALAFAFRNQFRKDVLVDLVVYRRWGHNELDEPTYTSPHMYRKINTLASVPERYEKELLQANTISEEDVTQLRSDIDQEFKAAFETSGDLDEYHTEMRQTTGLMDLKQIIGHQPRPDDEKEASVDEPATGVSISRLRAAGQASVSTPPEFNIHPRLLKMHVQRRLRALQAGQDGEAREIDFSTAEALAFGTLLEEGYDIRLSGQDSGRGTFSQRHALLTDQNIEGKTVVPLNELITQDPNRGKLEIVNSPLSEYAVLGFELGFSYMTSRSCLTLWEAQFGDFVNTAQVIVDQFLVSGQFKWPTFDSGLVLLLPHGLDGAGPEHSSCRVERFLQASNDPWSFEGRKSQLGYQGANLSICNPTTPAQYFHLLRRQMKRAQIHDPKGLVICTPKTILRLRESFSTLQEMELGSKWEDVLDDPSFSGSEDQQIRKLNVERVLVCSGKVYYDLVKNRQTLGLEDKIGIVRIEELAPFPYRSLHQVLKSYQDAKSIVWIQEEPENSGPLIFVINRIREILRKLTEDDPFQANDTGSNQMAFVKLKETQMFGFVARESCSSPATGISEIFKRQRERIEELAFNLESSDRTGINWL